MRILIFFVVSLLAALSLTARERPEVTVEFKPNVRIEMEPGVTKKITLQEVADIYINMQNKRAITLKAACSRITTKMHCRLRGV